MDEVFLAQYGLLEREHAPNRRNMSGYDKEYMHTDSRGEIKEAPLKDEICYLQPVRKWSQETGSM